MKSKISLLLAALLLLFCLIHPALSGQGCGTNWLGSDTNDQDFYVSKNQNLGATSDMSTPAVSVSSQSKTTTPTRIGQSYRDDSGSMISSLTPDKASPQTPGTAITWTAGASQNGLLYKFLLKGPSTEDKLIEKTNWTADNVWIWNTTEADLGSSQVEVRVRDGKHAGPDSFDDRKDVSFTINANAEEQTDVATSSLDAVNPHPPARTSGDIKSATTKSTTTTKTKPRIAPDERPRLPPGNPNGPNMSMPDPSPKPLGSTTSVDQASAGQTDNTNTNSADTFTTSEPAATSEPSDSESDSADVGGKWLVQFDNSGESMELILIQTSGSIMGSGSLNGETKIPLIASGSLDNDRLKLDVKTVVGKYVNQIDKRYNMDLKLADGTLSGSYEAYSGETSTGKGRVVATRPGT